MSDILDAFKETKAESLGTGTGKKLRVGIIGCGGIAKQHIRAYLNMPDVQIVAGCDVIPGRAAEFMKSFGALGAKTDVSALEVVDGRFTADLAVDGNMDTRLSFSAKEDVQYLIVDLGAEPPVKRINIAFFEHVSDYEVYVGDGESWELVYTLSGGVPRERITDEIVLDNVYKARYVKYVQLKRNYFSEWNSYYSGGISEFEVYGFDSGEAEAELRAAENIAFELDKSDDRRSAILDAAAALEAYLKADNLYESHYNALLADLRTAVENAGEEQEPVSDTEQSEPVESDDPLTGGDIVTFVIAAIIALAVLAVCIIAVVKKGV